MLRELVVHNFAIIEHLHVSFRSGLNVLSGETGAGKSILIGAVNLLLGSRASREMIRTGSHEARVEALFEIAQAGVLAERFERLGLEPAQEFLIRRTVNRSSRNRIFINDQMVTLQQLQELARGLVSVSGQHEHQLLLDTERHLDLLDAFGRLGPQRGEVAELHDQWSSARERLRKLRRRRRERADQMELMQFQLRELEDAQLESGEDEKLEQERKLLKHAATLMESCRKVYEGLYAERGAILERLGEMEKDLELLAEIDPGRQSLVDNLQQARIHLEELSYGVQSYMGDISFDPQRLAAVEERLAVIQKLSKKYGGPLAHLIERAEELRSVLSEDEESSHEEEELEKEVEALGKGCLAKALELSEQRHKVAQTLAREVAETLASLDMARTRFSVHFHGEGKNADESALTPLGIDRPELLLAANPGEDLKPLAKVASGGELSRILLALKSLLSFEGEAETLIFDEVDAGIGGRTAELVGRRLKALADGNQVLCITHLPQIACYGKHHYKVTKDVSGQETVTQIRVLSDEERIEELSRMLGGISISEKTRAHARELLQRVREGFPEEAQGR